MNNIKRRILFAVSGMSPAVITETIWSLVHQSSVVLPDEIVVLTTSRGREKIVSQLFEDSLPCGWERLCIALEKEGISTKGRLVFGLSQAYIRLFPDSSGKRDLTDIATTEDNAVAADFILRVLRAYTEDPLTQVYASIAGGRKTMGALLLSCMSLLGREQDHVLHVLVNEPFDHADNPPFLFPERDKEYLINGRRCSSANAKIELIDLPFVKMRGWYQDKFKTIPPSYSQLVLGIQRLAPEAVTHHPLLKFDFALGRVSADGVRINLTNTEFLVFAVAVLERPGELAERVGLFHRAEGHLDLDWFCSFREGSRFSPSDLEGDLSKVLTLIRKKIKAVPTLAPFVNDLVPLRGARSSYPMARISADVRNLRMLCAF